MGQRENGVVRIEGWIEQLEYAREVDLGILGERMITVHHDRAHSQSSQHEQIANFHRRRNPSIFRVRGSCRSSESDIGTMSLCPERLRRPKRRIIRIGLAMDQPNRILVSGNEAVALA